ncbi:MAG: hypothetical protein HY901_10830 [Deltaproteobacteria bacterium]|nr:hypothetical protein [Deltaproteobacteria bacterium]
MSEFVPNRRRWAFPVAIAALLALVPIGYYGFLHEPPASPAFGPDARQDWVEPPPGQDAAVAGDEVRVAELAGTVEIRRGRGSFAPAILGAVLQADDALRTLDGRARLVAHDSYDVQVEPGTELEIRELTQRLSRFELGLGMLVARVGESGGRRLEIAARGSDAVASSQLGTFAVSNNGTGTVAVGARSGEVELHAAGKAVILRAGQQSIMMPGGPPSEPAAFPSSLLLKIDWPSNKEINRRQLTVSGRSASGAVLMVSGRPVKVEKDGRFSEALQLKEGRNSLVVEGGDVAGNRVQARRELTVDTTAPDTDISTQKLWNP